MNTTIKKAFLLIFLIAVCCNATDEWKFDYETKDKVPTNFTIGQRIATGTLNIIPGVGSMVIMDDMTGAVVQWSLSGVGVAAIVLGFTAFAVEDCYYRYDNSRNCSGDKANEPLVGAGLGLLGSSFIYNIYRSITYDKPKQTAFGENSGFNLAVLPNRNGKLNAFLMYNKAF